MAVNKIPEGYRTVTPYLVVNDAAQIIDFLVAALGARVKERSATPDGKVMHAAVWIGDSIVMLGQGSAEYPSFPAMLYVYVPDVDAAFAQAVAAGGEVVMPPKDQLYGDRSGGFKDPSGNQWWLATHLEEVSDEETVRRYTEAKKQAGGG